MSSAELLIAQEQKIQFLETELNTLQKRCEQYSQAYDSLQHQVKELLRYRFGKKSERFIDNSENPQLSLFDVPVVAALDESSTENDITVAAHARKKKTTTKEIALPVRGEIIPVPDADKQCECGACKTLIRYETKQLIHHQPAVFEIVEQRREVVACPAG